MVRFPAGCIQVVLHEGDILKKTSGSCVLIQLLNTPEVHLNCLSFHGATFLFHLPVHVKRQHQLPFLTVLMYRQILM